MVRELSFGEVWVNKSATPRMIVRVNGIFMFSRAIQAKAQIIVEIYPHISRQVLLSNRDSLNWKQQEELDSFVNELATESITALEKKNKHFTQILKPGAAMFSKRKQKVVSKPEFNSFTPNTDPAAREKSANLKLSTGKPLIFLKLLTKSKKLNSFPRQKVIGLIRRF
jgi:hypothetical protein